MNSKKVNILKFLRGINTLYVRIHFIQLKYLKKINILNIYIGIITYLALFSLHLSKFQTN